MVKTAKACGRTSGYILYMADCFKKTKEENVARQDRMKTCAVRWKALDKDNQKKYKEKAIQVKAACQANGIVNNPNGPPK